MNHWISPALPSTFLQMDLGESPIFQSVIFNKQNIAMFHHGFSFNTSKSTFNLSRVYLRFSDIKSCESSLLAQAIWIQHDFWNIQTYMGMYGMEEFSWCQLFHWKFIADFYCNYSINCSAELKPPTALDHIDQKFL